MKSKSAFFLLGLLALSSSAFAKEIYLDCDDDRADEVLFRFDAPNGSSLAGWAAYVPKSARRQGYLDRGTVYRSMRENARDPGMVEYHIYSGRPASMFYGLSQAYVQLPQGLFTGRDTHGEGVLIDTYQHKRRALNCDVVPKSARLVDLLIDRYN